MISGYVIGSALCIAVGLLLVFSGRRIFWLFVATVGFLAGMKYAPVIAPGQPAWVMVAFGIFLGLAGAVLAVLLQRAAVAIAGAATGAMLASRLVPALGWADPTVFWAAVIVAALVAAVLASFLFDWALIVLTSLSGAVLVCDGLTAAPPTAKWVIGAALAVLGIASQAYGVLNPPGSAE